MIILFVITGVYYQSLSYHLTFLGKISLSSNALFLFPCCFLKFYFCKQFWVGLAVKGKEIFGVHLFSQILQIHIKTANFYNSKTSSSLLLYYHNKYSSSLYAIVSWLMLIYQLVALPIASRGGFERSGKWPKPTSSHL